MVENYSSQTHTQQRSLRWRWCDRILALPEFNLFLFAFLLHFVYEVWQAPFYDFYDAPTLAGKVWALTHCTFGDAVITVGCSLVVSMILRSRRWIVYPTSKLVLWFVAFGWFYTFFSEIYRTRIAHLYGTLGFNVPGLGISGLPLVQWLIIPPLVLFLARHQILGHRAQQG
ncbi:MAG: hypothetical protein AAF921_07290 [Cyanobacteria bacterium P01_D01_bin.44]